jgi:hypothetical protein
MPAAGSAWQAADKASSMVTDTYAPGSIWQGRLLGAPGVAVAFLWGLAEGTFFFVVPDVLLSLAAMLGTRRALRHVAAAVAGAVVAGTLMYGWAADSLSARAAVERVPFVRPGMFVRVDASYAEHGAWALLRGPLSGIPYKVFAVQAPPHVPLPSFLLATVPARLERLLLVWLSFAGAGAALRRLQAGRRWMVGLHAAFWASFYAYYWTVI